MDYEVKLSLVRSLLIVIEAFSVVCNEICIRQSKSKFVEMAPGVYHLPAAYLASHRAAAMQPRSCDEYLSVCLSVCGDPSSVNLSNAWIVTKRKKLLPKFLYQLAYLVHGWTVSRRRSPSPPPAHVRRWQYVVRLYYVSTPATTLLPTLPMCLQCMYCLHERLDEGQPSATEHNQDRGYVVVEHQSAAGQDHHQGTTAVSMLTFYGAH